MATTGGEAPEIQVLSGMQVVSKGGYFRDTEYLFNKRKTRKTG